jgi:hypothetical protein
MPDRIYRRAAQLMETEIGDELVALDVKVGMAFALNAIAASVWHSLAEPKSFEKLRNELIGEYDVTAEQCTLELQALLDDLTSEGLIEQIP